MAAKRAKKTAKTAKKKAPKKKAARKKASPKRASKKKAPQAVIPPRDVESVERALASVGGFVESHQVDRGVLQPGKFSQYVNHCIGWVYTATRALAQAAGEPDLSFYRKRGKRKTDWVPLPPKHPFVELLDIDVNPYWTRRELMEDTVAFMVLLGNAYWYTELGAGSGKPVRLWPLPAHEITIKPDARGNPVQYIWKPPSTSEEMRIPGELVVHFRMFNPKNRFYGSGPLAASVNAHNADQAITETQDYTFRHAPHLSALFTSESKKKLTPKERRRMELLLQRYVSSRRAGRALFLDNRWTYQDLRLDPKELDYAASGKIVRDRILAAFGVSPGVVGLLENASRSNVEATQYAFAKFVLKPILMLIQDKVNADLAPQFGKRLWAEFDDVVPADRAQDRQDWESAIKYGAVTANEYRQEFLGLDPVEDGDERLVPVNFAPISLLETLAVAKAAGAGGAAGGNPAGEPEESKEPDWPEGFYGEHDDRAARRAIHEAVRAPKPVEFYQPAELAGIVADIQDEKVILNEVMGEHVERLVEKGAAQEALVLGISPDIDMDAAPFVKALDARAEAHWARTVNLSNRNALHEVIKEGMREKLPVRQIAKRIEGHFDEVSKERSLAIARTEVVGSMNSGANALHEEAGIEREQWLATFDFGPDGKRRTRETHIAADGQIRKTGSKFRVGAGWLLYPGDPSGPAEEVVNCFTHHSVPIFTSEGWKPIGKIAVGDKVMTHAGRFERVRDTSRVKGYRGEVTTIRFDVRGASAIRGSHDRTKITVTPNHRVLTQRGWVEAKNVTDQDQVAMQALPCIHCGKPASISLRSRGFCSNRCSYCHGQKDVVGRPEVRESRRQNALRQWRSPQHRRRVAEKNQKSMLEQYANGTRDRYEITKKARAAAFAKYGPGGYLGAHPGEVQKLAHKVLIEKYGSMSEFAKQVLFPALGRCVRTAIEQAMERFLGKWNVPFEAQYVVGKRRVDFYVPSERLFVECDGAQFHQDQDEERSRDIEILSEYPDHTIAHVTYGKGDKGVPEWDYWNLERLNHAGAYTTVFVPVKSVERRQLKRSVSLWNFAVENAESYVAAGVVVHNCRCTVVPYLEGERAFSKEDRDRIASDWLRAFDEEERPVATDAARYLREFGRRASARLLEAAK